jgi:hypothetical protein
MMKSRLITRVISRAYFLLATVTFAHSDPPFLSGQVIRMVCVRATRGSKQKGAPLHEPHMPPLPQRFSRNCPFTCLMVDTEEHPGACVCHGCELWYKHHGYSWSIERPKRLVYKGGHKEEEIAYKNKYEWAQKKPKSPVSSEDSALAVTPESTEFNTTSVSPQGRPSTVEGELTPQQLDSNGTYTPPPNSEITPSKKINSGPISKALYKANESDLSVARHLLKTQNVTIKRLRNNLSSFRRAEKDRQANEKRQESRPRQSL